MSETYAKRYYNFGELGGYKFIAENHFRVFEHLSCCRFTFSTDPEFDKIIKNGYLVSVEPICKISESVGLSRNTVRSIINDFIELGTIVKGEYFDDGDYKQRNRVYYILGEKEENDDRKYNWYLENLQLEFIKLCNSGLLEKKFGDYIFSDKRINKEKFLNRIKKMNDIREESNRNNKFIKSSSKKAV